MGHLQAEDGRSVCALSTTPKRSTSATCSVDSSCAGTFARSTTGGRPESVSAIWTISAAWNCPEVVQQAHER